VEDDLIATQSDVKVDWDDVLAWKNRNWPNEGLYGINLGKASEIVGSLGIGSQYDENLNKQVVAVLDTGISSSLPVGAFASIKPGYDFVSSDISGDGDWRDSDVNDIPCLNHPKKSFHGTKTSFLVNGKNGVFQGTAYGSTLMPVRAMGSCGEGHATDIADSVVYSSGLPIEGMDTSSHKASIILLPMSGRGACPSFLQSAVDLSMAQGIVLLASGGNEHQDASDYWPGNCRGVISIGASDNSGRKTLYSNLGTTVSAPGGDDTHPIMTLAPDPVTNQLKAAQFVGTSASAAIAAGFTAIQLALYGKSNFYMGASIRPFSDNCAQARCGAGILAFGFDEVKIVSISNVDQDGGAVFKCSSSARMETSVRDPFPFETRIYRYPITVEPKYKAELDQYLSRIVKDDGSIRYYHDGIDWTTTVLDQGTVVYEDGIVEFFDQVANATVSLDHWATLNDTTHWENHVQIELFPPDWDMKWLEPNYTDSFGYWNVETGSWARKTVYCEGPIPPRAKAAVLPPLPFTWSFNLENSFNAQDKTTIDSLTGQTFSNGDLTCNSCTTVTKGGRKFLRTAAGMGLQLRGPTFNLPDADSSVGYVVREWEFPMKTVDHNGAPKLEMYFSSTTGSVYRGFTLYTSNTNNLKGWVVAKVRDRDIGLDWEWMFAYIPPDMVRLPTDQYDLVVKFRIISDLRKNIQMNYIKVVSDEANPGYEDKGWTRMEIQCSAKGCLRHHSISSGWWNNFKELNLAVQSPQYNYFNSFSITYHDNDSYLDMDSGEVQKRCGPTQLSQIMSVRPPKMRFHAQDYDPVAKIWYDSSGNNHHATEITGTPEKVTEVGNGADLPQTAVQKPLASASTILLPVGSYPTNYTICAVFRTRKSNEDPQYATDSNGAQNSIIGWYGSTASNNVFGLTWSQTLTWQVKCVTSGGGYAKTGYLGNVNVNGESWRYIHQLPVRGDSSAKLPIGLNSVTWSVSSIVIWDQQFARNEVTALEDLFKESLSGYKVNLKNIGACQAGLAVNEKCKFAPGKNPSPLYAKYLAKDWDATNKIMVDSSGNGRHSTSAVGTIQKGSGSGSGASVNLPFIKGGTDASILFGPRSIPPRFTICTVSRYDGDAITGRRTVARNYTYQAGGMVVNQEADVHFIDPRPINRGRIVRGDIGSYRAYKMPVNHWELYPFKYTLQTNTSSVGWFHGHSEYGIATAAYGDWDVKTYPTSNVDAPQTNWLVTCGQNRREVNTVLANNGTQVSRMERILEPGNIALSSIFNKRFIFGGTSPFYVKGEGNIPLKIGEPSNIVTDGSNLQCQMVNRTRTLCDQQETHACFSANTLGVGKHPNGQNMRAFCAVAHGKSLQCKGFDNPSTTLPSSTLTMLDAGANIIRLTASSNNFFAMLLDNNVILTGNAASWSQVDLQGNKALDFDTMDSAYCVIEQDTDELQPKQVKCWGSNSVGQLGNPDVTSANSATRVTVPLNLTEGETPESLFTYNWYTIGVVTSLGRIKWWGRPMHNTALAGYGKSGEDPVSPFLQYPTTETDVLVKKVGMGYRGACAIRLEDDKLVCWGLRGGRTNSYLQIHPTDDYSTNVNSPVPEVYQPPTVYDIRAKDVSLGWGHACIIRIDDELLYCWGMNNRAQTGVTTSTYAQMYDPNRPVFTWQVSSMAAGHQTMCVIRKSNGQVHCWGDNVGTGVLHLSTTSHHTPLTFPAVTTTYGCDQPGLTSSASKCPSQFDDFGCYSCSEPIVYEAEECLDTHPPVNNASDWAVNSIYVWDRHLSQNDLMYVTKQLYKSLTDSTVDQGKIGGCEAGHALPDYCMNVVDDFECGPAAACAPGTQASLTDGCVPCPTGTSSNVWSKNNCAACEPGSYSDEPGALRCKKCPYNTYKSSTGGTSVSSCQSCPGSGFTNIKGAKSVTDCLSCPS